MVTFKKGDVIELIIVFIILIIGVAMFISASLGILVKNEKIFSSVLTSQLVLGLGFGLVGMYVCYKIPYKFWRQYSLIIFLFSIHNSS